MPISIRLSCHTLLVGAIIPNRLRWAVVCVFALLAACSSGPALAEYPTTITCPHCPTLRVHRIIDGDTLELSSGRVRLFGVDTPERGERCYRQALNGLRQLAGSTVKVESGPRAQDPGGRLLYYLYTVTGNSIDEILVREGLARAWTRDGQHRQVLLELERETQRASKGCLW